MALGPVTVLRAGDFSADAKGTTGAAFLTMGMGARAVGMGGAYSAVAADASAVSWNPAGLNGELVWEGKAGVAGSVAWSGRNRAGRKVASGLYLAHFEGGSKKKIKKLSVVK